MPVRYDLTTASHVPLTDVGPEAAGVQQEVLQQRCPHGFASTGALETDVCLAVSRPMNLQALEGGDGVANFGRDVSGGFHSISSTTYHVLSLPGTETEVTVQPRMM